MITTNEKTIQEYTNLGYWGHTTLWELFERNVSQRPQHEAVVDPLNKMDITLSPQRRLTYEQLAQEVTQVIHLLSTLGLKKNDIIAIQLANSVEQYVIYLAAISLGIIISPLPVQYREHEIEHIVSTTQCRAFITNQIINKHDHESMIHEFNTTHKNPIEHILVYDAKHPNSIAIERRRANSDETKSAQLALDTRTLTANDVVSICWTSGTESKPKGVPRSHNQWLVVGQSVIHAPRITSDCRLLNPFPFVNMAGISTNLIAWLVLGATVVQHHPFNLPVFLEQIRLEKIDYTVAPPTILNLLLQNPTLLEGIDFKKLNRLGSGSAPLSRWMIESWNDKYGVEIINYFGSNEGIALGSNAIDVPDPSERSVCFPIAGLEGRVWNNPTLNIVQSKIIDLDTGARITAPNQPGELCIKGPTVFDLYWGQADVTARTFDAEGYYKTGDLFEITGEQQQYYRFVGRAKDIIIRGGMNISPEEVEELIISHPKVKEVAVVGYPDENLGERMCACIVSDDALTLEDITQYLHTEHKVANFKLPEKIILVEALPRNPVGKVVKQVLRERVQSS